MPALYVKMPPSLFFNRLAGNFGFAFLLGVHFFQQKVFVFKLLHAPHQRGVHPAEFRAPQVEAGAANAMFPAQIGAANTAFVLIQHGKNLAAGKP